MFTCDCSRATLRDMWVEFDGNIEHSCIKLSNKAYDYNLKHIIEEKFERIQNSIKKTLEEKLERSSDELSLETNLWKALHRE